MSESTNKTRIHDAQDVDVCPECGRQSLARDPGNGELVCRNCGVVVSETERYRGQDWRAYTLEEKQNLPRAGLPLNPIMHDRGLSTTFNPRETGGMDPGQRYRMWRMKKRDRRSKLQASDARNLSKALNELTKVGNHLNLPRFVLETASRIYRQALQEDLIRGRTIKNVAAACLYMACRKCSVVRGLDEIASKAQMPVKSLARDYRTLFWGLDLDIPDTKTRKVISQLTSKLGLLGETEKLAELVLEEAEEKRLTAGKHPAGIAASCIYISTRTTGDRVTQEDVSSEAGITPVTIRNRYKKLMEKRDIVIPL